MKHFKTLLLAGSTLLISLSATATPLSQALIDSYTEQTGIAASSERGKAFWFKDHNGRSCTRCHGTDVQQNGKHVRTQKVIEPMAPSVNTGRLSDPHKVAKWFKRNCKWTLKRECTPAEKADVLLWLQNQ